MELRHLRYFVCVAEELNFTRAAEKLGISQPPLSAQIKQLETELGTPLFRRLTRGVELTEAGVTLLDAAKLILEHVETAKQDAERRGRGEMGRLRIGFSGGTYFTRVVPAIVLEYRRKFPDIGLTSHMGSTTLLCEQLLSGDVDVGFVRAPLLNPAGIAVEPVSEEEMVLVFPEAHPLAHSPWVPLAALALETLILPPRPTAPGFYDKVMGEFARCGVKPILGMESPLIEANVSMVRAGFGVSLVPRSVSGIHCEGVKYVPIGGTPIRSLIEVAFRQAERSPAIRNFIGMARQVARSAAALPQC